MQVVSSCFSMKKHPISLAAALALGSPVAAQEAVETPPSPNEIVEQASAEEWVMISPEDLLVMTLSPNAEGNARKVVIQLMPEPFSQGWVENIRKLAAAGYWDGSSINRVQENYVVQWGQPDPGTGGTVKPVPEGLNVVPEECYEASFTEEGICETAFPASLSATATAMASMKAALSIDLENENENQISIEVTRTEKAEDGWHQRDPYADWVEFYDGWPVGARKTGETDGMEQWSFWPVHCYGMVGVGRDLSPDTGDGSQLYTVIGEAPRHLDRNIALVGRIIEGMEHLTTLPRGTGPLGFYETEEERVPIVSALLARELSGTEASSYEYLQSDTVSFERYVAARAARRDPFFNVPANGIDICNIPVPVRRVED